MARVEGLLPRPGPVVAGLDGAGACRGSAVAGVEGLLPRPGPGVA